MEYHNSIAITLPQSLSSLYCFVRVSINSTRIIYKIIHVLFCTCQYIEILYTLSRSLLSYSIQFPPPFLSISALIVVFPSSTLNHYYYFSMNSLRQDDSASVIEEKKKMMHTFIAHEM